jgi:hypothetical protein
MSFFIGNLSAVILSESRLDKGKSVIGQAGEQDRRGQKKGGTNVLLFVPGGQ